VKRGSGGTSPGTFAGGVRFPIGWFFRCGVSKARNRREVTFVSDMLTGTSIGKWYDPISERWFAPHETKSGGDRPRSEPEAGPDVRTVCETQRIWNLLVDCCARG